jgi:hypothetical protein
MAVRQKIGTVWTKRNDNFFYTLPNYQNSEHYLLMFNSSLPTTSVCTGAQLSLQKTGGAEGLVLVQKTTTGKSQMAGRLKNFTENSTHIFGLQQHPCRLPSRPFAVLKPALLP